MLVRLKSQSGLPFFVDASKKRATGLFLRKINDYFTKFVQQSVIKVGIIFTTLTPCTLCRTFVL
ncbi:hypothetical protein BZG13_07330 [Salinivibrio sp. ML323]|nr:hypothetical protein BZG13_07330 [Salinivibrio sp. ML323]